jgi:hypothetical protein
MSWRDVPMPPQIAALPRDPRGYPVFHTIQPDHYVAGEPADFRTLHVDRHVEAGQKRLCAICGRPLPYWLWFLGGPMCLANRIFGDGPMHRDCMDYALQVCPYLTHATMEYGIVKDPTFMDRVDDAITGDPNVITRRPERILLLRTRGYTLVMQTGGKPAFRVDAPVEVQWLANDAKPLSAEEARKTYVLCPAAGAILCLVCQKLSHNPNDGANRYCGSCHRFHDDPKPSGVPV